ncbi:MAG: hypothetical protein ACKN82_07035, partial [Pirellula sp.]
MRLLKGWKLTLMASMALAGSSGHAWAQKPGSWGATKPSGSNKAQMAPVAMPQPIARVAYQEPIAQEVPVPTGVPLADGAAMAPVGLEGMPVEGIPIEGMPMMGPEGCPPGMMMGPGMMDPGMMGPGMMGPCPECGGPCPGCGGSHLDRFGRNPYGLFAGLGGCLAGLPSLLVPYGEGGIASQRWYDASIEGIGLTRTSGGGNFAVSSLGANSGNYVLNTDMVAPSSLQGGLAAQVNVQVGPGSNLEVAYFGLQRDEGSAVARSSSANLFSFIS